MTKLEAWQEQMPDKLNKPEKELTRMPFIMAADIIQISKIKYEEIDNEHAGKIVFQHRALNS